MTPISTVDILLRLVIAGILAAIIGWEREYRHRPAGIRTNAIAGIATALMTIISVNIASMSGAVDISRIAANILVGIGFIGAGAIIQARGIVKGLTTAATIWMVAGIGMAVGLGMYNAAIIATILVLVILIALRNIQIEEEDAHHNEGKEEAFRK